MFRKITAVATAVAASATLAVAASPADAARPMQNVGEDVTFTAQPPGGGAIASAVPQKYISGTDDDGCQRAADAANSWIDAAVGAWYQDDQAAQDRAQRNADAIAGEANAKGCVIYD